MHLFGYPEFDELKEKILDNLILDKVNWCYFSNIDDLVKEVGDGYLWTYLFKCLHFHKYKISVDYD